MLGIVIIAASFTVAIFGFVKDNKAKQEDKKYLGLTKSGLILIGIATIGFVAGITKEVNSINDAKKVKSEREELVQTVKETNAMLKGIYASTDNPEIKEGISKATEKLEMTKAILAESNFSMSDFTNSDFAMGMFRNVNFFSSAFDGSYFNESRFIGAKFDSADFRGVDLSKIVYDETTSFPK